MGWLALKSLGIVASVQPGGPNYVPALHRQYHEG